mmetsp:Transcript_20785/g.48601  ORF Transcript_20785/g.48601 Transcript_20785/m.48601 type:complete len:409 (-) Transcript_20785:140-1366(-)
MVEVARNPAYGNVLAGIGIFSMLVAYAAISMIENHSTSGLHIHQEAMSKADRIDAQLNIEARRVPVDYVKSHFLVYQRGGGLNNRIQALEIGLVLAVLLNRTLVIQTIRTTHGSERGAEVPYTDILEPVIAWPTVQRGVDDKLFQDVMSDTSRQPLPLHPNDNCSVDLWNFVVAFATNESANLRVVEFPWYCGFWQFLFHRRYHPAIARFLDAYIRFKAEKWSLRSAPLPSTYALVHFRLGDKPGFPLFNCSEINYTLLLGPNLKCKKKTSDGSVEHLTTDQAIRFWHIPEQIKDVYIATNRPLDARVVDATQFFASQGLTTWLWENISWNWRTQFGSRDGSQISAIEQTFAMNAQAFLPAWSSSWDAVVLARRFARGSEESKRQHNYIVDASLQMQRQMHRPCSSDA